MDNMSHKGIAQEQRSFTRFWGVRIQDTLSLRALGFAAECAHELRYLAYRLLLDRLNWREIELVRSRGYNDV